MLLCIFYLRFHRFFNLYTILIFLFFFLSQETIEMYSDENKNDETSKSMNITDLFSSKFCLQICSMLLQHINEGKLIILLYLLYIDFFE